MKVSRNILRAGVLLATTGALSAQIAPPAPSESHGDPYTPVGELLVTPTVVQPGVHPEMFWNIDYPQSIPDLVVINKSGSMKTLNDKSDKLTVRIAGMPADSEQVALWASINGGSWDLVFYGTDTDVDAGTAVFSATIQPGTRIDLAARGNVPGGGWSHVQWTGNPNSTLEALIDGTQLPSEVLSRGIEDFMTQYVGANNELVVGPRDVVHLFEVGTEDAGSPAYNLQDLVVVCTFGKNNNGHGNNIDGVDSSNPGQGLGGPNGAIDASLNSDYVDDERIKIRKK